MERNEKLGEGLLPFANGFLREVRLDLADIKRSFFSIGFRLNEANEMNYYSALGYQTIEELAESEFGFKRSTTYNLINVFRRFCVREFINSTYVRRNQIDENFKDYSYSQLLEFTKFNYIPMSIRTINPEFLH